MDTGIEHFRSHPALHMWDVWNEPELCFPQRNAEPCQHGLLLLRALPCGILARVVYQYDLETGRRHPCRGDRLGFWLIVASGIAIDSAACLFFSWLFEAKGACSVDIDDIALNRVSPTKK